jgi:hypothetical protein
MAATAILGTAAPAQASPVPSRPYQLVLQWGLRCLETPLETDGVNFLFQWPCHGGSHQKWTFEPASDGYYTIKSAYDEGCASGIGSSGQDVRNRPCRKTGDEVARQQWRLSEVEAGYYEISNLHTGLCLDILHGGNGSHAIQFECRHNANQLWALR